MCPIILGFAHAFQQGRARTAVPWSACPCLVRFQTSQAKTLDIVIVSFDRQKDGLAILWPLS